MTCSAVITHPLTLSRPLHLPLCSVMALKRGAYHKRGANYTDMATLIRCVRPDQSSATVRWGGMHAVIRPPDLISHAHI